MDPRWQPHLGAVQPAQAADNLEASDLLAHGWHAEHDECWIAADGRASRMVSLDTGRALRDRTGFVRARLQPQR
ncbi:hypothetical protein HK414_14065 [Ramlibacter terrae]|uniref:Uncharacterized protein n=1 Tax=Ramlibacter terrae TaxID=2732511 RepID=A0ABX6P328_9BURK|nr:hypothetical protein HK414_14065 [Ramlibacter terrae]